MEQSIIYISNEVNAYRTELVLCPLVFSQWLGAELVISHYLNQWYHSLVIRIYSSFALDVLKEVDMKNLFAIIEPCDLDIAYDKSHSIECDVWEGHRYLKPCERYRSLLTLLSAKDTRLVLFRSGKINLQVETGNIQIHVYR